MAEERRSWSEIDREVVEELLDETGWIDPEVEEVMAEVEAIRETEAAEASGDPAVQALLSRSHKLFGDVVTLQLKADGRVSLVWDLGGEMSILFFGPWAPSILAAAFDRVTPEEAGEAEEDRTQFELFERLCFRADALAKELGGHG